MARATVDAMDKTVEQLQPMDQLAREGVPVIVAGDGADLVQALAAMERRGWSWTSQASSLLLIREGVVERQIHVFRRADATRGREAGAAWLVAPTSELAEAVRFMVRRKPGLVMLTPPAKPEPQGGRGQIVGIAQHAAKVGELVAVAIS